MVISLPQVPWPSVSTDLGLGLVVTHWWGLSGWVPRVAFVLVMPTWNLALEAPGRIEAVRVR